MGSLSSLHHLPLRASSSMTNLRFSIVIHGGAGTLSKEAMTPERRRAYKATLTTSLEAGYKVLSEGGDAMEAVVAAVTVMEDSPLFNAGKGAVFNIAGKNELEASLMLSKPPGTRPGIPHSRRGLGLTLLTRTKNPSHLVQALYLSPTEAPHTFLSGKTAEDLGASMGVQMVDPSYFFTERRWKEHREGLGLPAEPLPSELKNAQAANSDLSDTPKGTVGAVALDADGRIAVLTSTGGRTNKLVGRIGDTPLMGAGFWAEEWDQKAVGVSGTGDGDYFIRRATAVSIVNRVRFGGESLKTASENCIEELRIDGGLGGVIALDNEGNVTFAMNCTGMYRGFVGVDGIIRTAIFADEEVG